MIIKNFTIDATIPTVQYGNIHAVLGGELETGDNFEEVRNDLLRKIKVISDMTAGPNSTFEVRGLPVEGATPVQQAVVASIIEKTSELTGVTVQYDDASHKYTDAGGNPYMSGSKFPEQFYSPFDSEMILGKLVAKYPELSAGDIRAMWNLSGDVSTNFGSSVHAALENYDKYSGIGAVLAGEDDPNKALSKNALLRTIVEKFHENREKEDVLSECFVANEEYKLAGTIDRLLFIDREKKIVRIQDYKTDGDISKKMYQKSDSPLKGTVPNTLLGLHFLQLSFYAFILSKAGYTVEGLDVFWLNPDKLLAGENPWETFTHEVVDIESVITKE